LYFVTYFVTTHVVKVGPPFQGRAQRQHCRASHRTLAWITGSL